MSELGSPPFTIVLVSDTGFWYLHCHVEYHNEMGMGLVVVEGEPRDMPPAPEGVPRCGDFRWSAREFRQKVNSPAPPGG